MDALKKLKTYPHNAFFLLWVILVFLILTVFLTSMILMSSLGSGPSYAAAKGKQCAYSFSPSTVVDGDSVKVSVLSGAPKSTYLASIVPTSPPIEAQRVGLGDITLKASMPGSYSVVVRDYSTGIKCSVKSGSVNLMVNPAVNPCVYDVNDDGIVDQKDVDLVNGKFGETAKNYPEYDVNWDGNIDLSDSLLVAGALGKACITYQLLSPAVSGNTVTFGITPSAGGNVALSISNGNLDGTMYISPLITGDKFVWNNAPVGSHSAQLVILDSAGKPVDSASNSVLFYVE